MSEATSRPIAYLGYRCARRASRKLEHPPLEGRVASTEGASRGGVRLGAKDSPHPDTRCARVDPPPPGEGKASPLNRPTIGSGMRAIDLGGDDAQIDPRLACKCLPARIARDGADALGKSHLGRKRLDVRLAGEREARRLDHHG